MTMVFYLGKEIKLYEQKFNELKIKYMNKAGDSSNSAIFRYIVDVLYKDIKRKENKMLNNIAERLEEKEV
jgi:hypothetical protein